MHRRRWYHGTNVLIGITLLLYPSLLGLDGHAALVTYGVGGSVATAAICTLIAPHIRSISWCTLFLGAGYFLAPGVVEGGAGFPPGAAAVAWIASLAVMACSWSGIEHARRIALSTAQENTPPFGPTSKDARAHSPSLSSSQVDAPVAPAAPRRHDNVTTT